jgi:integrase
LGLRAGEIAHLMIRYIDWRAGAVTLRRTKSLRQDVLPLPVETG